MGQRRTVIIFFWFRDTGNFIAVRSENFCHVERPILLCSRIWTKPVCRLQWTITGSWFDKIFLKHWFVAINQHTLVSCIAYFFRAFGFQKMLLNTHELQPVISTIYVYRNRPNTPHVPSTTFVLNFRRAFLLFKQRYTGVEGHMGGLPFIPIPIGFVN